MLLIFFLAWLEQNIARQTACWSGLSYRADKGIKMWHRAPSKHETFVYLIYNFGPTQNSESFILNLLNLPLSSSSTTSRELLNRLIMDEYDLKWVKN